MRALDSVVCAGGPAPIRAVAHPSRSRRCWGATRRSYILISSIHWPAEMPQAMLRTPLSSSAPRRATRLDASRELEGTGNCGLSPLASSLRLAQMRFGSADNQVPTGGQKTWAQRFHYRRRDERRRRAPPCPQRARSGVPCRDDGVGRHVAHVAATAGTSYVYR